MNLTGSKRDLSDTCFFIENDIPGRSFDLKTHGRSVYNILLPFCNLFRCVEIESTLC